MTLTLTKLTPMERVERAIEAQERTVADATALLKILKAMRDMLDEPTSPLSTDVWSVEQKSYEYTLDPGAAQMVADIVDVIADHYSVGQLCGTQEENVGEEG